MCMHMPKIEAGNLPWSLSHQGRQGFSIEYSNITSMASQLAPGIRDLCFFRSEITDGPNLPPEIKWVLERQTPVFMFTWYVL